MSCGGRKPVASQIPCLHPCPHCKRAFSEKRLLRHVSVCPATRAKDKKSFVVSKAKPSERRKHDELLKVVRETREKNRNQKYTDQLKLDCPCCYYSHPGSQRGVLPSAKFQEKCPLHRRTKD